jgi:hypothetical protein
MGEHAPNQIPHTQNEKISEEFTLEPIGAEAIPENVAREIKSMKDSLDGDGVEELVDTFLVAGLNGLGTYVMKQENRVDASPVHHNVYVVDAFDGQVAGISKLVYEPGIANASPMTAGTITRGEYAKRGLGTRRMEILNALSLRWFSQPLHASSNQSPQALSIWKKFVATGKARPDGESFVFNDPNVPQPHE